MGTGELIATILGSNIVTNLINSFITWAQAKKKYNTEVDANLIQNMQESLNFYIKLSDDNQTRLTEVLQKNEDNNARLAEVLKKNDELNSQVVALQSEILEIYKFMGVQSKEELVQLKNSMSSSLENPRKKSSEKKQ